METSVIVHRSNKEDGLKRIKNLSEYRIIRERFHLSEEDATALTVLRKLSSIVPESSRIIASDMAASFMHDKLHLAPDASAAVIRNIASWTRRNSFCKDFIVPHWIRHILPDDPKPSFLSAGEENISEIGSYLEIDRSIVPLIRHIISSHTPMMLRIDGKKQMEELFIFGKQLGECGIPVFILLGNHP